MAMPARKFNNSAYRYGFNGKENDKELSEGAEDFGARIYDNRLGRWMSKDPAFKIYAYSSPYTSFGNNSNYYIDPGGETLKVAGNEVQRKRAEVALQKLTNDKVKVQEDGLVVIVHGNENPKKKLCLGTMLLNALDKEESTTIIHLIAIGKSINPHSEKKEVFASNSTNKNEVYWDPNSTNGGLNKKGNTWRPAFIGLIHELIHSFMYSTNIGNTDDEDILFNDPDNNYEPSDDIDVEEYNARVLENRIRAEQGLASRVVPDMAGLLDHKIPRLKSGLIDMPHINTPQSGNDLKDNRNRLSEQQIMDHEECKD